MSWSDSDDKWIDSRIEAFVDGELSADEQVWFEALIREEGREGDLLAAAGVRDALRTLPRPACPPEVTLAVLAHARRDVREDRVRRLRQWFDGAWLDVLRPALAMGVLLLIVLSAALLGPGPEPRPAGGLTAADEAEIEVALEDAKWALAYLSDLGRRTGRSVRDDVLEPHVLVPMQDAVDVALDGGRRRLVKN